MMKNTFVTAEAKTSLHKTQHIIVTAFLIFKGGETFSSFITYYSTSSNCSYWKEKLIIAINKYKTSANFNTL